MPSVTRRVAFISVGVGTCQSEDSFVCFGRKPTRRACARDFPRHQKRTRERSSRDVGRTEETKAVNRREQELGQWNQARLANARKWVSIPSGFVGISLDYTLALAHRSTKCEESVTNFSFLALGAKPSPWLFVLLFFHTLGWECCGLCIRKEMWNTPGRRCGKWLDNLIAIIRLSGRDSGGWPAVCCHTS